MINAKLDHAWYNVDWLERIDYEKFKQFWPLAPEEKPDKHFPSDSLGPCRISYEEVNSLMEIGVKLELVPLPGAMMTKMRDNRLWYSGETPTGPDLTEGKAIQIAIPDNALLFIDEVDWMEDACTQELQGRLDEGWRILAVCPPNAARRPDYILGRRKANPDPFDRTR